MMGKQKTSIDANFIGKAVKSIIETVQSSNKANSDENSTADNVFNSIYKKIEETMKNAGNNVESKPKDELGADDEFLKDVSFEKVDDDKTEINKIKTTFKIEEEKLKVSFEDELKQLKISFKEKHENLKQDFQSKIDALKTPQ